VRVAEWALATLDPLGGVGKQWPQERDRVRGRPTPPPTVACTMPSEPTCANTRIPALSVRREGRFNPLADAPRAAAVKALV